MILHQREKFQGRHLKGDRDILVGIHHDHIIFVIDGLQIGPPVVGRHPDIFGQIKIDARQIGDLLVDLHPFHHHIFKIFPALVGVGTGTHPQDQHFRFFFVRRIRHQRRCQRVIIIHAGKPVLLHFDGLHPKQYVGR